EGVLRLVQHRPLFLDRRLRPGLRDPGWSLGSRDVLIRWSSRFDPLGAASGAPPSPTAATTPAAAAAPPPFPRPLPPSPPPRPPPPTPRGGAAATAARRIRQGVGPRPRAAPRDGFHAATRSAVPVLRCGVEPRRQRSVPAASRARPERRPRRSGSSGARPSGA